MLIVSVVGLALVALFLVALAADATDWWHCTKCGEIADSVLHFVCVDHRCATPTIHHEYSTPAWPYLLLSTFMVAVVMAMVLVR